MVEPADTNMLACGIYTIPYTASLLGISGAKVRSWATAPAVSRCGRRRFPTTARTPPSPSWN